MTGLRQHLVDYLAVRRAVGFKLARPELLLHDFVAYLEDHNIDVVTNATSIAWASLPPVNTSSRWHAHRLSAVRVFARYLHVIDPVHEIPPPNVFPTPNQRVTPFIYSGADVEAMMFAARGFANPLRAASMEAVIGLLAVQGCGLVRHCASTGPMSISTTVFFRSSIRSSVRTGWSRSIRAPVPRSLRIRSGVTGSARSRPTRPCSSPLLGPECCTATSTTAG